MTQLGENGVKKLLILKTNLLNVSILVWRPFQCSGAQLYRTTDRTICLNSTLLPSTGRRGLTRHGNATHRPASRLKTSSQLEYRSTEWDAIPNVGVGKKKD